MKIGRQVILLKRKYKYILALIDKSNEDAEMQSQILGTW